ncbi:PREDICTED: rho GTPase-activating protein 30 [Calidris pugnax]|uniref:rho GTPase-activating protein 30 n=1 Tax=Calidris pugnax TaxID=198806 RepID=UPI00071CE01B|nr:PREDICTED: rho GTPase-activating protein 30 [Calidris pugnax]
MEEARLVKIKEVLKELPPPHYRTLEFLMRHLLRMASHSAQTNMHARNLAIVWAPNLLRSKDIEATGFNGTAAFMEVRVQSIVVEFILTHVEQLFGDAPLHGSDSPRRSLLLGGGGPGAGQPPPFHVPAALSQGADHPGLSQQRPVKPPLPRRESFDACPCPGPEGSLEEKPKGLEEPRGPERKGSLKAKKWRSIFNLGRSGHEAKRKLGKAEEKGADHPGLSQQRPVKPPLPRRESFDACPCPGPEGSLEEKPKGLEEPRGPESEGESSTKSEPTTPKGSRASLVATGRSPKAARSRAERCAGVHISGPFSVTVPFHITSNLSRLTRGLPCPALGRDAPDSPPEPTPASHGDPQPRSAEERLEGPSGCQGTPRARSPLIEEGTADAEQTRLSLELRDSFAFLDSTETWPEGGGDGDMVVLSPSPDTTVGDREESPAMEEGMESGFMNPGEPPTEHPASYLSIEEAMDEEMFFMAPSGSDPEEGDGDTDSDDMFLSANDDLSPLVASLGTLQVPHQPPGEGTATETPALARPSTPLPQDGSPSLEEDAPGLGELLGDPTGVSTEGGTPPGKGDGGEGVADGGSSPGRTDPSTEAGLGDEAGGASGHGGAGPAPDMSDREVEEDGAGPGPPDPEEPGEGEPQPSPGTPPASTPEESPQEPAEPPVPESVPEVVPGSVLEGVVPEAVPRSVPEVVPRPVPEALPPSMVSAEGTDATPSSSPASPSLPALPPELHPAPPEAPLPTPADPPGSPGLPQPVVVLRHDGSAPARLAARTVRVQQARSVPVVPPKPQFAKIPPAPQSWASPSTTGDSITPPQPPPSPPAPEGPSGASRRAGWREGGSASFDTAVSAAAQQPPAQGSVRRIQTYSGGEAAPAAPKALPFQKSPMRPRLLRPLSCMAAPEAELSGRSRRSLTRPPEGSF